MGVFRAGRHRNAVLVGPQPGQGRCQLRGLRGSALAPHNAHAIFRPNGFGLFDVAGNVAEWVEDCWNESYKGAPTNGSAWMSGQCQQRSLRGGSFASKASLIRSPARFRYDQDVRYYANGFRVARDL